MSAATQRHEHVVEHIISYVPAQGNALRLVEFPMDTEIDAALAVLFLRLGERREAARKQRTYVTIASLCDSVEFVRYERERDVVSAIKPAEGLKNGAPEPGVARRIGWEWRRKVRSSEVAGRSAQRRPGWVTGSRGIAITGTRWPGARVGLADAGDGTPDIVMIFRVPDGE